MIMNVSQYFEVFEASEKEPQKMVQGTKRSIKILKD